MLTGIGIGLVFGCVVFALVWCKGDVLSGLFTADAAVIANGYAYLKGFAPGTIATAILFGMMEVTSIATTTRYGARAGADSAGASPHGVCAGISPTPA